jgi:hypothetical protein
MLQAIPNDMGREEAFSSRPNFSRSIERASLALVSLQFVIGVWAQSAFSVDPKPFVPDPGKANVRKAHTTDHDIDI